MDLRQLETMVAIADHGTFSAAARALFTVQSNVSSHVARLERELGVRLVDRQRGGLTDDGVIVVERARRVLRELDDIASEMASRGEEVHGDARIGTLGTTARWVLPALLIALRRAHPGVHPLIHEGNTTNLVPRLLSSHLDAIVVHLPIDSADVTIEPLFSEDLLLVAPAGHPLAAEHEVSLGQLAATPLLLPPTGTALRRVLDRAAAAAGVGLQPAAEIDGVRLMASLSFEGFGAAIVPATAVPVWLHGDFHRIAVPELPRRTVAWVQRKRPAPTGPTRVTLSVLRQVLATQAASQPGVHIDGEPAAPAGDDVVAPVQLPTTR